MKHDEAIARTPEKKKEKKNTQTHTNTLGLCVDGIMGTMLNFFVSGALSVVSFGIDSCGHSSCIHISIVNFQFHLIHINWQPKAINITFPFYRRRFSNKEWISTAFDHCFVCSGYFSANTFALIDAARDIAPKSVLEEEDDDENRKKTRGMPNNGDSCK